MPHSIWPPLPCSRQAGRKTCTWALALGIPPRKSGASTEIGHLGAERPGAYPRGLFQLNEGLGEGIHGIFEVNL